MNECNCPRGKWELDKNGWFIWVPFPSSETLRTIDLETRVANLEAALAKMEESK
jgi:hypothetical protein